jgi:hypothetical protein
LNDTDYIGLIQGFEGILFKKVIGIAISHWQMYYEQDDMNSKIVKTNGNDIFWLICQPSAQCSYAVIDTVTGVIPSVLERMMIP